MEKGQKKQMQACLQILRDLNVDHGSLYQPSHSPTPFSMPFAPLAPSFDLFYPPPKWIEMMGLLPDATKLHLWQGMLELSCLQLWQHPDSF